MWNKITKKLPLEPTKNKQGIIIPKDYLLKVKTISTNEISYEVAKFFNGQFWKESSDDFHKVIAWKEIKDKNN